LLCVIDAHGDADGWYGSVVHRDCVRESLLADVLRGDGIGRAGKESVWSLWGGWVLCGKGKGLFGLSFV
jgi:hypothetical protein